MFFLAYSLIFLFSILRSFGDKLCCLLLFEGMFIYILFFFFFFFNQASNSFSGVLLIMLCFLVLDSVFGLCLLVSHTRNSFIVNKAFSLF